MTTYMKVEKFGIGLYSPRVAARVARIRYQSLQAWAKANLFHASVIQVGKKKESSYTYYDLLLIRLVLRLKDKGFRPKQVRRALETISLMSGGDRHAWLRATICVDSGLIVAAIRDREDWNPIAASEGPQRMALVFFPDLIEELKKELVPEEFRHVEIDPEVLGGAPVIKGTRIPTRAVAIARQSGQDPRVVYPTLTDQQVSEAEDYEEFLEAA